MAQWTIQRQVVWPTPDSWPAAVRWLARLAEFPYALAVHRRNARFDRQGPDLRMPIPVISVGNVTVGGTGKTPFVIALVKLLAELGRRPAVVARGYKAAPGHPGDEERVIRAAFPDIVYVADADRCRAARLAHQQHRADVIVLDDGFQHRALGRDLDLVLIDATCPFGFNHLLPRGLLREPLASLRRADAVLITRCEQALDSDLTMIEGRIREFAPDTPVLRCRHRVTSVESPNGHPVPPDLHDVLAGKQVALFAGIARPQAFERTVEELGAETLAHRWFPDHHRYTEQELAQLIREFPTVDWIVTTEKDAVKLPPQALAGAKIAVVKVAIDLDEPDSTMLRSLVSSIL
jgi:tetraacyldisaccharide 4'-kinase